LSRNLQTGRLHAPVLAWPISYFQKESTKAHAVRPANPAEIAELVENRRCGMSFLQAKVSHKVATKREPMSARRKVRECIGPQCCDRRGVARGLFIITLLVRKLFVWIIFANRSYEFLKWDGRTRAGQRGFELADC